MTTIGYGILFCAFLNFAVYIYSQDCISGSIQNEQSKEAIEFVTISVKGKNVGTYSNIDGIFNLTDFKLFDTLVFRHISFISDTIPIFRLLADSSIFLSPTRVEIAELKIRPRKNKEVKIGYAKQKSNSTFSSFSGFEIAVLIENKQFDDALIKNIILNTKKDKNNIGEYLIKTHFYENNDGIPGKEIQLSDNIHTTPFTKSERIIIDVSNEGILFPANGIFVGIEWIGEKQKSEKRILTESPLEPHILISVKGKDENTYCHFWDMSWTSLATILNMNKPTNALIGLTLSL